MSDIYGFKDIEKVELYTDKEKLRHLSDNVLQNIRKEFYELKNKENISYFELIRLIVLEIRIRETKKAISELISIVPPNDEEVVLGNIKVDMYRSACAETDLFYRPGENIAHSSLILYNIALLAERILHDKEMIIEIKNVKFIEPINQNLKIIIFDTKNEVINENFKIKPSIIGVLKTSRSRSLIFYCKKICQSPIIKRGFFKNDQFFKFDESVQYVGSNSIKVRAKIMNKSSNIVRDEFQSFQALTVYCLIEFIIYVSTYFRKKNVIDSTNKSFFICKLSNIIISDLFLSELQKGVIIVDDIENGYISVSKQDSRTIMLEQLRILPLQKEKAIRVLSIGID